MGSLLFTTEQSILCLIFVAKKSNSHDQHTVGQEKAVFCQSQIILTVLISTKTKDNLD